MKKRIIVSFLLLFIFVALFYVALSIKANEHNLYHFVSDIEIKESLIIFVTVVGISFIFLWLTLRSKKKSNPPADEEVLFGTELAEGEPPSHQSFDMIFVNSKAEEKITLHRAIKCAVNIGIIYAIVKNYSLLGIPIHTLFMMILLDTTIVTLIAFPLLWIFFHFKNSDTAKDAKKSVTTAVCSRVCPESTDAISDQIAKYQDMLEKGIITEKEFDRFKKSLMKEMK
ncbi:MAG TPA: SHOCT domain-containing protein [Epsilonproteobacteria bacterium]|nr:SHOCT domain-containing protein [Campylobacterota bacterium]HHH37328.1 SHOCT domain-containing protein [Campylobacterota bacterium]